MEPIIIYTGIENAKEFTRMLSEITAPYVKTIYDCQATQPFLCYSGTLGKDRYGMATWFPLSFKLYKEKRVFKPLLRQHMPIIRRRINLECKFHWRRKKEKKMKYAN